MGVGCEYTIVKGYSCGNTMVKGIGCGNTMVNEKIMEYLGLIILNANSAR